MSISKLFPRRRFLQGTAATMLANKTIVLQQPSVAATGRPSSDERVRFGMVGIGMQGSGLLGNAISLHNAECLGAADLYDGRHKLAREITGNSSLPVSRNYHDLLTRKDIDCIIAAVPDHWHRRVVVDACNAGKDIYCEKPMSHTISQGYEMVEAAQRNNRIVQIGSQRVSSALCAKARELYQNGAIGDIELVELTMGRNDSNGAWQYPPPPDLSTQNLDWDTWLNDAPKIPLDPLRFARWRCWKEYGTGVAGDLMVHLLSGMQYTLGWNEAPRSATSLGGIFRWNDGRNMPDTLCVLFDYHGIPVYVRLNLGSETPEVARFLGPKGVLEASGSELRYSKQTGLDGGPSYYSSGFPHEMRAAYVAEWNAQHRVTPGKEPISDSVAFHGDDWDDVRPHLWNFFEAVKSRRPVAEDVVFGNHAAIACHMANESYFRKSPVHFDESSKSLKA